MDPVLDRVFMTGVTDDITGDSEPILWGPADDNDGKDLLNEN